MLTFGFTGGVNPGLWVKVHCLLRRGLALYTPSSYIVFSLTFMPKITWEKLNGVKWHGKSKNCVLIKWHRLLAVIRTPLVKTSLVHPPELLYHVIWLFFRCSEQSKLVWMKIYSTCIATDWPTVCFSAGHPVHAGMHSNPSDPEEE